MPQVVITPFPAIRARLEQDKYNALAYGFQNATQYLGQAFLAYSEIKQKEKEKKLAVMTALGAKYGFNQFGPNFAQEYERLLGVGEIFPRVDGKIHIPQTHEEEVRNRINEIRKTNPDAARDLDMVEAGLARPLPTLAEQNLAHEKTAATERTHELDRESREHVAGIGAESRIQAANIAHAGKYDPKASPSGMGFFKGRMYPMAKLVNRQTGELKAGAREIPLGELQLRQQVSSLRNADELRVARVNKLQLELANDLVTKAPALAMARAFVAAKKPEVANKILAAHLRATAKSYGATDKEVDEMLADRGIFSWFSRSTRASVEEIDKSNAASAVPEAEAKSKPGTRKLSTGIEVQEEEVQ